MAETSYLSDYDGATTDDILDYAKAGKEAQVNEKVVGYEQSGVKGYVDQMKGQTTVSDADTVQVFDTNGVPHKIAKTELLKKSAQALPTISDISAFIALNKAGNAIGLMSIEETAKVVGGLSRKGRTIGWVRGYTKLTDNGDYGTIIIYVTGDNRYSILGICDHQKVLMLKDGHSDAELGVYHDRNGNLYLYNAFNMYLYIISSSYLLSIATNQSSSGLIKIPRL